MNTFFKSKRILKFSDYINYEIGLTEGLIHSYDVEKMYNKIETYFKDRLITIPPELPFDDDIFKNKQNGYVFGVELEINNYTKNDEIFLLQLLKQYGYFISKQMKTDTGVHILIEPKNPVEINDMLKDMNIKVLYHITHKSNLEKINKIGLTPRQSETSFLYPDDRIYLIFSQNLKYVKAFKQTLARDKNRDYTEFVVLSTPFNETYKYYIDEFSTRKFVDNIFIGCFVTKNIPPNQLNLLNI